MQLSGLELTIDHLLRRATRHFPDKEIVTLGSPSNVPHRYTFADFGRRVAKLATALRGLGVSNHSRVATLAWSHHQHLESYFAIPMLGASIHTVNARLHPTEVRFVIRDSGARLILADVSLRALLDGDSADSSVVLLGEPTPDGSCSSYENLVRGS